MMTKLHTLSALVATIMALPAQAEFRSLWTLGTEQAESPSSSEFSQENQGSNPAPGSPTLKDDDYYFAGTYPDPIGVVAENEPIQDPTEGGTTIGFERALVPGDPVNRIHFNLTQAQVDPEIDYRFRTTFCQIGAIGDIVSTHDVRISFNGVMVYEQNEITADLPVEADFGADEVNAVAGENVVTIERIGGSNSSWIQFDFLELQLDDVNVSCTEPLCNFDANGSTEAITVESGDQVTLAYQTSSAATVTLNPGEISLPAGNGTFVVAPTANTEYSITSSIAGGPPQTASIPVNVSLIESFTVNRIANFNQRTVRLDVNIDRNDSAGIIVEIDNGIGDISSLIFDGNAIVTADVDAPTTFTLTVRRPNGDGFDVETRELEVQYDDTSIIAFDAFDQTVTPGSPDTTLFWEVPDTSGVRVFLDPAPAGQDREVTDLISGGIGELPVSLTETTTFTLTVSRDGVQDQTQEVTVELDIFENLWVLGSNDGGQNDFHRETNTSNTVEEGSPTILDDDYFFAGTYPDPIGTLAVDEVLLDDTPTNQEGQGFERAVGGSDPFNRIHFNLTEDQATAENLFKFTLDLNNAGVFDPETSSSRGYGTHDITISMNGQPILTQNEITADITLEGTKTMAELNAVAGANVVEIHRTGGDGLENGGNSGWIQFDFLRAEVGTPLGGGGGETPAELPVEITYNASTNVAVLSFPSNAGETFSIFGTNDLVELTDLATFPGTPVAVDAAATGSVTTFEVTVDPQVPFFAIVTRN